MRVLRSRKWRTALLVIVIWFAAFSAAVYRNWSPISGYVGWWYQRELHAATSREGVRKDLARGRFKPGDSAEDLIAKYPPTDVIGGPRYQQIVYRVEGSTEFVRIIARDGRLAVAWMNSPEEGTFELFDTFAPGEYLACVAEYRAASRERRMVTQMAVGGPAATILP